MTLYKPRAPESVHEALGQLIEDAGGAKEVAAFEGVATGSVYRWLDPEGDGQMSVVRAARLALHSRSHALANFFAQLAGGVFIPAPPATGADTLAADAGLATRQFGRLMSDLGRRLEDGRLDRKDDAALARDADRVLVALYRFRETAMAGAAGQEAR